MIFEISSRKLNRTLCFWAPDNGGYIHVDTNGQPGVLGQQLTVGGTFWGGDALETSSKYSTFERICRRWYRSYIRKGVNNGL